MIGYSPKRKIMNVLVSGVVHSLDPIFNPVAYAKATFVTTEGLEVSAEGKQLKFFFSEPFKTDSLDSLLPTLIESASNVEWNLTIAGSSF